MVRVLFALLLLPLAVLVPATAAQAGGRYLHGTEHCVVSHEQMEVIVIRRAPNNYSLIEKRLHPGECRVHVVDACGHGWCPVRQGAFTGWVHRENLAPVSPAAYCVAGVDRGWTLDLHEGPSHATRVVVSLAAHRCGIAVTPNRIGHWVEVRAGPYYGWVAESSIR